MDREKASRLHRYAAITLALFFAFGFIVSSFYEGESGVAAIIWIFGFSIYLPFYVLHAEFKGTIYFPRGAEFSRGSQIIGFRFIQIVYLVAVIVLFAISVREFT
jgi:hypothetical protein